MNIGIYTKDLRFMSSIKKVIHTFMRYKYSGLDLIVWEDMRSALFLIGDEYCDGFIIDITNNTKDELCGFISKLIHQYPHTKIIILIDDLECIDWFLKYKIFKYMSKKNIMQELETILGILHNIVSCKKERTLELATKTRYDKIYFCDILYINREGKNVNIFTTDRRCITFRMSLMQIYEKLDEKTFIYIDKGCIVNSSFVTECTTRQIRLINGIKLPVSRDGIKRLFRRLTDSRNLMPDA
ncbi:LytTR family DNA-binding domain-containing protein [Lachnospiraceae bacterium 54-53]